MEANLTRLSSRGWIVTASVAHPSHSLFKSWLPLEDPSVKASLEVLHKVRLGWAPVCVRTCAWPAHTALSTCRLSPIRLSQLRRFGSVSQSLQTPTWAMTCWSALLEIPCGFREKEQPSPEEGRERPHHEHGTPHTADDSPTPAPCIPCGRRCWVMREGPVQPPREPCRRETIQLCCSLATL